MSFDEIKPKDIKRYDPKKNSNEYVTLQLTYKSIKRVLSGESDAVLEALFERMQGKILSVDDYQTLSKSLEENKFVEELPGVLKTVVEESKETLHEFIEILKVYPKTVSLGYYLLEVLERVQKIEDESLEKQEEKSCGQEIPQADEGARGFF